MNAPPPTPAVGNFTDPTTSSDDQASDFDLPELDYDDDPFSYFSGDEDAYDRRDRRIHAWLHQQCRFALNIKANHQHIPSTPGEDHGRVLKRKGSGSTTRTKTSAATPSEEGSDVELEDARADSPLLGFPSSIPVDKPLPTTPPSPPPKHSPSHSHSRSLSSSSGGCIPRVVPLPLSRRPSLLRQPSLPQLGETDVFEIPSDDPASRARTHSNASVHVPSSPLPPHSPPTRRQSRIHTHAPSISSLSYASSSPLIEPITLSHASSSINLTMSMAGQGMRNAVYIDSEEVRKRLDDIFHLQARESTIEGDESHHQYAEDGQEVEVPPHFRPSPRHQTSLSSSSNGTGSGSSGMGSSLFTPPPSAASNAFFSSPTATPFTTPRTATHASAIAPPNTPMTHIYQTPYASSSQVYLGPGTPPAVPSVPSGAGLSTPPVVGRGRSESISVPVPVTLPPLNRDIKPPTRPPPAPPLSIESPELGGATRGSPYGRFHEHFVAGEGYEGVEGDLLVPPPIPPPHSMSKWSLSSSTMDVEEHKEKGGKKRKSFMSGVIGGGSASASANASGVNTPAMSGSVSNLLDGEKGTRNEEREKDKGEVKEKKRSRLISFISRLSEVGGSKDTSTATTSSSSLPLNGDGILYTPDDAPPVPPLLPSPILVESKEKEFPKLRLNTNLPYSDEVKIAGSVRGTWESATLAKSAPSSPVTRRKMGSNGDVPPLPLSSSSTSISTMQRPPPLIKAASDGLVAGLASNASVVGSGTTTARARSNSSAAELFSNKPSPSAYVGAKVSMSQMMRPRPALTKSVSSSVLSGAYYHHHHPHNLPHHHLQPQQHQPQLHPHPLSPSEEVMTEAEDEDGEDEEEEDDDYGRELVKGFKEAHVRWAVPGEAEEKDREAYQQQPQQPQVQSQNPLSPQAVKVTTALFALNPPTPGGSLPTSVSAGSLNPNGTGSNTVASPPNTSAASTIRQRLRSISSVGNLASAAAAAAHSGGQVHQLASASNVALPMPMLGPEHGKENVNNKEGGGKSRKGFKDFVNWIGLSSSNSNGEKGTGSALQTPQTPGPFDGGFTFATGSGTGSAMPSPNHSPTASLSLSSPLLPSSPLANSTFLPTSVTTPSSPTLLTSFPPLSAPPLPPVPTSPPPAPPHSPSSPSTASALLSTMRKSTKPKRKLIIGGLPEEDDDTGEYEAVKAWCEGFGEVREFVFLKSGGGSGGSSLVVDFKKTSVADTVCRLQTQVFIKGVGSVTLSWSTKKRSEW